MTRKIITGIVLLALSAGMAGVLAAEENEYGGLQKEPFLHGNLFLHDELSPPANDSASGVQGNYTFGERAANFGMNFIFGLGAFRDRHTNAGISLATFEVGGIVLLILPPILGWNQAETISMEGFLRDVFYVTGAVCLGIDILLNATFSFFLLNKPQAQTARVDDIRNWQVGFYPDENGRPAGQIAFTAHF
jgi:hypothetical protein